MNDLRWNKVMLDEFRSLALLTDFEYNVLQTKIAGWSRTKQSIEFNCSLSTIDRTLKVLRSKYDDVSKYSSVLPTRIQK